MNTANYKKRGGALWTIGAGGKLSFGGETCGGLYFGGGAASAQVESSTADQCIAKFYTKSSATSGDNRGLYWKHDFTGAGGGGDCARFYAVAKAAIGTMQGVHSTGEVGTGGSISGLLCGLRATLGAGTTVNTGGTLCALQVDSDLATAITGLGSFIRIADNGAQKMPYFLDFATGVTAIAADTSNLPAAATHKIKCRFGSTDFYLIGVADF